MGYWLTNEFGRDGSRCTCCGKVRVEHARYAHERSADSKVSFFLVRQYKDGAQITCATALSDERHLHESETDARSCEAFASQPGHRPKPYRQEFVQKVVEDSTSRTTYNL
jgi:predicted adenine nucleotide alpha hydrolase (AANH) superfamily ATPase